MKGGLKIYNLNSNILSLNNIKINNFNHLNACHFSNNPSLSIKAHNHERGQKINSHMDTHQNLLTENDVAAYLNVSKKKLQKDRQCSVGIPYVKIGSRVLYLVKDVNAYIDQCRVETNVH